MPSRGGVADSGFATPASSSPDGPFLLRLHQVVAIQVHHLVPRRHKGMHERLRRVATRIDFREGSELGVQTEDEIDNGARPLELARRPIAYTPLIITGL